MSERDRGWGERERHTDRHRETGLDTTYVDYVIRGAAIQSFTRFKMEGKRQSISLFDGSDKKRGSAETVRQREY